jgi:hypothetical protein
MSSRDDIGQAVRAHRAPRTRKEEDLNRSKGKKRTQAKPVERKHLSLALPPTEVAQLKMIMGWMLTDPEQEDARPCFQTAVRYALAHTVANPPAHVRAGG